MLLWHFQTLGLWQSAMKPIDCLQCSCMLLTICSQNVFNNSSNLVWWISIVLCMSLCSDTNYIPFNQTELLWSLTKDLDNSHSVAILVVCNNLLKCDRIKRNESDVGHIVFEILQKMFKFLCFILFLALTNSSTL